MTNVSSKTKASWWRRVDSWLLVVGILLLGIYVGARFHGELASRIALWRFKKAHSARVLASEGGSSVIRGSNPAAERGSAVPDLVDIDNRADVSLWSDKRIQEYRDSLAGAFDPLGVLRIQKLGLVVPVFEGTDDLTLNRGAGRIAGTARIGENGNVGIAGHRDGFFRVLKDIAVGDSIELQSYDKTTTYIVRSIEIVKPENTEVLRTSDQPSLTLVTCYPFYFVGSAPQRFIVHASAATDRETAGDLHRTSASEAGAH